MNKIKKSSIYTKTGDSGLTSLFNGMRLPKDDFYFQVLGAVDEANSMIGIIDDMFDWDTDSEADSIYYKFEPSSEDLRALIESIQSRLLDIGSHVATPLTSSASEKIKRTEFGNEHVKELEKVIDQMDSKLPKLINFILPKGIFHLIRTSIRKIEIMIVTLVQKKDCDESILRYLNRLSDFFFVLARYTSSKETIYKKPS